MDFIKSFSSKLKLLLMDAIIMGITPILAIMIRFEGRIPDKEFAAFHDSLPWMVSLSLIIFYLYGMYHRIWHYARMRDLLALVGAVTLSQALIFIITIMAELHIPRSIPIITWLLTMGMVGFSRLLFKIDLDMITKSKGDKQNLLIVGAGDAGAMLVRELEQNDTANTRIVGFIDDDEKKRHGRLAGFPILGNVEELTEVVKAKAVDKIVIAIPSADGDTIRHIDNQCRNTGAKVCIMPGIYSMINGKMDMGEMRDISLEDLLRRDPIHLDFDQITSYISGKTVLITGAGGSIGSEISRQISRVGAREIILLGRGENSIYEIQQELTRKFPEQSYRAVIANITDRERMERIFAAYKPQVVFHAAAHKHVPLMEIQPDEAIRNNVFGTKNVAELADKYGAETFVLISTDKAVNPTSVMGATKRTAELVLQKINQGSKTRFVTVRFGNVLGSRGSVVPLFEREIAAGGPVTVTHKEMTRFFMTIPEAVQLVLQAGSQAEGGEVFLFDMGKPVKIKDMAEDLIRLHGLVPGEDIKIVYTGLRPGEKLYEELLTSEEGTTSTKHKKIFKAMINPLDEDDLDKCLAVLHDTTDKATILKTLKHMIPTYKSQQLEALEGKE